MSSGVFDDLKRVTVSIIVVVAHVPGVLGRPQGVSYAFLMSPPPPRRDELWHLTCPAWAAGLISSIGIVSNC